MIGGFGYETGIEQRELTDVIWAKASKDPIILPFHTTAMKMGSQELLVLKNEVHGTKSHQPLQSLESRSLKQSYLRECDNSMFFASTCGDVLLLTDTD